MYNELNNKYFLGSMVVVYQDLIEILKLYHLYPFYLEIQISKARENSLE